VQEPRATDAELRRRKTEYRNQNSKLRTPNAKNNERRTMNRLEWPSVSYNACGRYYFIGRRIGLATSRPENLAKSLSAEAMRIPCSRMSAQGCRISTSLLNAGRNQKPKHSVSVCQVLKHTKRDASLAFWLKPSAQSVAGPN